MVHRRQTDSGDERICYAFQQHLHSKARHIATDDGLSRKETVIQFGLITCPLQETTSGIYPTTCTLEIPIGLEEPCLMDTQYGLPKKLVTCLPSIGDLNWLSILIFGLLLLRAGTVILNQANGQP